MEDDSGSLAFQAANHAPPLPRCKRVRWRCLRSMPAKSSGTGSKSRSAKYPSSGLSSAFDGLRVAQLSDIHLDEFTEPFFLRDAVNRVNSLNPDVGLSHRRLRHLRDLPGNSSHKAPNGNAPTCSTSSNARTAMRFSATTTSWSDARRSLRRSPPTASPCSTTPICPSNAPAADSGSPGSTIRSKAFPNPDKAIPESIRNVPNEPIVLLCHAPDYADNLLPHPAGKSVSLMLCGHTHGGQVRLAAHRPLVFPDLGRKYVEGWFRFGNLQLSRQSRPRHRRRSLPVQLPARDHAAHAAFRLNCSGVAPRGSVMLPQSSSHRCAASAKRLIRETPGRCRSPSRCAASRPGCRQSLPLPLHA